MNREEAIRILKNFSLCGVYHQLIHMNDTDSEAISMAIKALEQQESCEDVVSRQEAIALAKDICVPMKDGTVYKHRCIDPDAIKELPSAQPEHNPDDERKIADLHKMVNYLLSKLEQRWIPVTERLPNNDDWVIVTILDERGDTPFKYTDFGWYLEVANCWIIDSEQRTDVIAWMPLPKPYRGGENGE